MPNLGAVPGPSQARLRSLVLVAVPIFCFPFLPRPFGPRDWAAGKQHYCLTFFDTCGGYGMQPRELLVAPFDEKGMVSRSHHE